MSTTTTLNANESVGLVGLRSTATKNKLTDTVVPVWDLTSVSGSIPATESFNHTNPSAESVIGADERVRVGKEHFAPGGKYRSIVKLFLRYENQKPDAKWPIATGWLIRPNLLVTAGHCAFDWGHNMGRLVQVKAYIGYYGQASIADPNVQFRCGSRIATTLEWLTAKGNRNFDVSFITLDKPFEGVKCFGFADTPLSGSLDIGVVGYPGDLKDPGTGEPGAHMYEMYLPTKYNLADSQWRMLEYDMDTYGGNSGSPVLRQSDLVSIGVHVYGGSPNSASVIGLYGNPFLDYVAAFDLYGQKFQRSGNTTAPGVQYITVPTSKTPDTIKGTVNLNGGSFGAFTRERGFTSAKHSLSQQHNDHSAHHNGYGGAHSYNQGESLNDPGVSRANGASHHYLRESHSGTYGTSLISERSLTTERRLGGRSTLPPHARDEEGFFDLVKQGIGFGGPILKNVIGTALPLSLGPLGGPVAALAGIAISAAGKLAETGTGAESAIPGVDPLDGVAERAILAEAALTAMMKMDNQVLAEEGFFDDVWSVAKKVLPVVKNVAPKVLDVVAKPALQLALENLNKGHGAEGLYTQPIEVPRSAPRPVARTTANTGAVGLMDRLEHANSQNAEGFFGDIAKIASKGLKGAVPVLSLVAKHGLPLLQGAFAEADMGDAPPPPPVLAGMDGMHQRAVLAEAALQAALKAPQHVLEEEGFFDIMSAAVAKIAPIVLKAAPQIIKTVGPVVDGILKQQKGGTESLSIPNGGSRGLRKIPSNNSIRGERSGFGHNLDLWHHVQTVHGQGEAHLTVY
ncbi:hypothetical protein GP486_001793 [Trichoglossum hirsutum]|uniref:Serine protease n=1 Tax=Trichoglossum hirsutum TaxID=265104 RepID=A0A9P8LFH1_9PEZI|nr:hypothetical protein GP486_001793 [Trichoglossum hirsutum]